MKLVWTTVCHRLLASLKKGSENINFHFQSENHNENCQSCTRSKDILDQLNIINIMSILRATTRKEFPTPQMSREHEETIKVFSPGLTNGIRFLPFTCIIAAISCYTTTLLYSMRAHELQLVHKLC